MYIHIGLFIVRCDGFQGGERKMDKVQKEMTCEIGIRFVKIPDRDYYMGRYTITQKEWTSVMGTTPWIGMEYVKEGDDYPATFISWHDCQELVKVLNGMDEENTYRIPTEEDWFHACMAGSTKKFYFGDDASRLGEYAWYIENTYFAGEKYAHGVGRKKPNMWGLYDMHGNLWEWCEDWNVENRYRVIRGGSWGCYPEYCDMAGRGGNTPGKRFNNLGVRLIMSLE